MKKKSKPKKLSDEDYENYIMQLKDDRPARCIVDGKSAPVIPPPDED